MPTTAQEVGRFSKSIIETVQEGNANAIEVLVMLRALEAVSETVREAIKQNIDAAADKYSERSFEVAGARIEKSEVGVSYDYTLSNDREWERCATDEKTAAACRKARETFLRALKEPMDILDKETGEVMTLRPPLKRSNSGLKVFLK